MDIWKLERALSQVRRFTNTLGQETIAPYNVHYVRCTKTGAVRENAKEQVCWCGTFATWAKEPKGYVGNLEPESNQ